MNEIAGKRSAIVTGCTGEIGNALVRLLLETGFEVYALCRPGSWRLRYLPEAPALHIVECDIFRLNDLQANIPKKCDAFFHLGWHASYGEDRNDPYGQVHNVAAALDAVNAAARVGCKVFVGAGTLAQYGSTEETIRPDTTMNPTTVYGAAKLCAEHMTRTLSAELGIRHVWGRILSVYGPCDGPYTLVSGLMRAQLHKQTLNLTPCEQLWDFLYARDAAQALLGMAEKGRDGRAYCVASGISRPLSEFISEFLALFGSDDQPPIRIGGKPYPPGQRMRLCCDIAPLVEDTDFIPRTSFSEGIAETWAWYVKHPEATGTVPGL